MNSNDLIELKLSNSIRVLTKQTNSTSNKKYNYCYHHLLNFELDIAVNNSLR
jgi:hypothetical protein